MTIGLTPATASVTLTNADTEYTITPPSGTKRIHLQLRTQAYDLLYAFASGGVFITIPAGSPGATIYDVNFDGVVLIYLKCATAGQIVDYEYWTSPQV